MRTPVLVAGSAVALGALIWYATRKKPKKEGPKGFVRCPTNPVKPEALRIGDYAVIELVSRDGSFYENTWARILGTTPTGNIKATLIGESGESGKPKPIGTDKHGFVLGKPIVFSSNCVMEIYRPVPKPGRILCGNELPVEVVADPHANLLEVGDFAQILVADREGDIEELWTQVFEVGPEGQVIYAKVYGEPERSAQHGYAAGEPVVMLRDCIIDVSLGAPPELEPTPQPVPQPEVPA